MNVDIRSTTLNTKAHFLQQFKNLIFILSTLGFLLFGILGNILVQAFPVTDSIVGAITWTCTEYANSNNNFSCTSFLSGGMWEFPADFKLGVGTATGGSCANNSPNSIICNNIPVVNTAGDYSLNYSGTGLAGGVTANTITVKDLLTQSQDLAALKTCPDARANSNFGTCTFTLPAGAILPDSYTLSVQGQTPSLSCSSLYYYPTVRCTKIFTGTSVGNQNIVSSLNPSTATGSINIFPFFTAAEEFNIVFNCNPSFVDTTTYCLAKLPPNRSVPIDFKLGVGVDPVSGQCFSPDTASSENMFCENVKVSQIFGPNKIISTLSPLGNGSNADVYKYLTKPDEDGTQIVCDIANTNSLTRCNIYNVPAYTFFDSNYQLGVGTVVGGTCSNRYSASFYCLNVPTGPNSGQSIKINSNISPNGTTSTSVLDDSSCINTPTDYIEQSNAALLDFFSPIVVSAAGPCCGLQSSSSSSATSTAGNFETWFDAGQMFGKVSVHADTPCSQSSSSDLSSSLNSSSLYNSSNPSSFSNSSDSSTSTSSNGSSSSSATISSSAASYSSLATSNSSSTTSFFSESSSFTSSDTPTSSTVSSSFVPLSSSVVSSISTVTNSSSSSPVISSLTPSSVSNSSIISSSSFVFNFSSSSSSSNFSLALSSSMASSTSSSSLITSSRSTSSSLVASSSLSGSSSSNPSTTSSSSITPIFQPATTQAGTIIQILSTPANSSNAVLTIVPPLAPPTETVSTKIYDLKKLLKGKVRPNFTISNEADDRAAIKDPYSCGGNIYGSVEYAGDYSNIEVLVNLAGQMNYNLPVEFNEVIGTYTAKIDYSLIKEDNYDINYQIVSKISSKKLDEGFYSVFISNKCGQDESKIDNPKIKPDGILADKGYLVRTGGAQGSNNLIIILSIMLIVAGLESTLVTKVR